MAKTNNDGKEIWQKKSEIERAFREWKKKNTKPMIYLPNDNYW